MNVRMLHLMTPLLLLTGTRTWAATAHGEAAHGHGGSDAGGGAGLPQFNPEWFASQIFWLVLVFFGLYLFFSRKTLPVIAGVLENRREHIQGDLDTADRLTKEADLVHAAYEQSLEEARVEAAGVIAAVEAEINQKSSRALESFQERSEREIATTEARIAKARSDVMHQIDHVSAEVAAEAANRIVPGIGFTKDEAYKVVDKLYKEGRAA